MKEQWYKRLLIIKTVFRDGIEDLIPGYFAMVMATGIISIAAYFQEIKWLAIFLFVINIVIYLILFIL